MNEFPEFEKRTRDQFRGLTPVGSAFLIVAIIAIGAAVVMGYGVLVSGQSSTATFCCTTQIHTPFFFGNTTSTEFCNHMADQSTANCRELMSYSTLDQLIQNPNNSFTNDGTGTIQLYVGHNPCVIWSYYLPNGTNVLLYLGTTGTTTCA